LEITLLGEPGAGSVGVGAGGSIPLQIC